MKTLFTGALLACSLTAGVAMADLPLTDNQDGTLTDQRTGLVWAKNGNCFGNSPWSSAMETIQAMNKGSKKCADLTAMRQDWRLPSRAELATLIDKNRHDSGLSLPTNHPFVNVQRAHYWTREKEAGKEGVAWYVNLHNGHEDSTGVQESYFLWPVAGPSR